MLELVFICILFLNNAIADSQVSNVQKNSCPVGEHWVREYNQSAYTRDGGTPVSGSFHRAGCHKNPPSYAVWHDRMKNGFPSKWEYKNEKQKPWSDDEKERVLEALSALPDALLLKSVEGIYRMKTYLRDPSNPAANHEYQITLYDEAFKSKQNLGRVLAHEFAHNLYRQFYDEDKGKGYANISDWIAVPLRDTKEMMLVPNRDGFVAEDGKEGPDEDFSNNIEYFLFNPKELKAKTPKVYHWIQQRYGDKFRLGKDRR